MESQEFNDLTRRLQPDGEKVHTAEISDREMAELTPEQAEELVALYGWNTLIRLPQREQEFFAWLRREDPEVWNDLWGDGGDPYIVSLAYLIDLLPKRRGFVIRDLERHQNFVFSADSITAEDGRPVLDAALDIIAANGRLSMEQAFLVEVWRAPIDQWRFAYLYNLPLAEVKKMVLWLLQEKMLLLPTLPEEETPDQEPTTFEGEE